MKGIEIEKQLLEGVSLFTDNNHREPTAIIIHPDSWKSLEEYVKSNVFIGIVTPSGLKIDTMFIGIKVYRSEDADPDKILFK